MKRIGCYLLNRYDAITEEVVDNDELTECIRGNPVIYAPSSKDVEIAWKELTSAGNRYCISRNKVYTTTRTSFMEQSRGI